MTERAYGFDTFGVGVAAPLPDHARERGIFTVARYDAEMTAWLSRKLGGERPGRAGFIQPAPADFDRYRVQPYSVTQTTSNLITQAGYGRILNLAIGAGGTTFGATTTRIGVGTATAAAATGQTDLSAATGPTNRQWKLVTGAGTTAAGTATARLSFVASFGTGEANFVWAEFGTDQGTADGTGASTTPLLNRAVSAQGTKASGQTWTATETLDFS
jgi:hypothetical protein